MAIRLVKRIRTLTAKPIRLQRGLHLQIPKVMPKEKDWPTAKQIPKRTGKLTEKH